MSPSRIPRLGPSEVYAPQPPKAQSLASYACGHPDSRHFAHLVEYQEYR